MAKKTTGGRNAGAGGGFGGGGALGGVIGGNPGGVAFGAAFNAMVARAAAQTQQQSNAKQDWADMTDIAAAMLRRMLGQTGDEAGQQKSVVGMNGTTYIQSAKSYLVNNALNNDMQSVNTGFVPANAQYWINRGYNVNSAKSTIRQMDNGMKPLVSDTRLVRYEGGGDNGQRSLELLTGVKGLNMSKVKNMTQAQLDKLFVGRVQNTKQYLSTSWRMDPTSSRDRAYMSLPIRKEYLATTGVHAIVTNNVTEHEVVVGRGYDQHCVGARMENGQLVLTMALDSKRRSGYYKI